MDGYVNGYIDALVMNEWTNERNILSRIRSRSFSDQTIPFCGHPYNKLISLKT